MRLVARVLATVVATSAVALAVSAVPAPSGAVRADALSGAPEVGSCYDLTRREAVELDSVDQATLACTERHTLWVSGVVEIPADVPLDPQDTTYSRLVTRGCLAPVEELVGDDGLRWARSAYGSFTFHATEAQQAAGAHWASCAVGLYDTARTLDRTSDATPARLTGAMPTRLRLCGTASYARVSCSAPHVYRSVHATWVRGRATDRAGRRAADRICPSHVRGRSWMWATRQGTGRFSLTCLSR